MTIGQSLLAFTAAAALLTATPGLDTALVLRTAIAVGARPALRAGMGIVIGCFTWGLLAAFGLGALIALSAFAFDLVKIAGAAYLAWLGLRLLRPGARPAPGHVDPRAASDWLRRGLLTNLLNPKVGVFYVSFLPQFIPAGANVIAMTLLMTAIHALLGLLWFSLLVSATRPLSRLLANATLVRWLDRITGGLFIAFGIRLALAARRS
ncbi:MAG: LysE family translocator [Steroidobacteraceae bacterium]